MSKKIFNPLFAQMKKEILAGMVLNSLPAGFSKVYLDPDISFSMDELRGMQRNLKRLSHDRWCFADNEDIILQGKLEEIAYVVSTLIEVTSFGDATRQYIKGFDTVEKRGGLNMARLPEAVSLLQSGAPRDLQRVLIACILHAEEEMLLITPSQLSAASNYKLIVTVGEDDTVVLIAEPKV